MIKKMAQTTSDMAKAFTELQKAIERVIAKKKIKVGNGKSN